MGNKEMTIEYIKSFEINELAAQIANMMREHPDWTTKEIVRWLAREC
jgi:formylmethanofuran dehydrogenase subunit A